MSGFILETNLADADAAVISAVETPADLGPENLKDPRLHEVVRLTGGDKTLTIDLGADQPVAAIAFASAWFTGHLPLEPEDAIRFAVDGDGGTAGAGAVWDYDGAAGVAAYIGNNVLFLPDSLSGRYITLTVDRPDPVDISRIWPAPAVWRPEINIDYTLSDILSDSTVAEQTETANVKFFDVGERHRVWPVNWQRLTPAEIAVIRRLRHTKGVHGQIVFGISDQPALVPEWSLFARFADLPEIRLLKSGHSTASATLEESH